MIKKYHTHLLWFNEELNLPSAKYFLGNRYFNKAKRLVDSGEVQISINELNQENADQFDVHYKQRILSKPNPRPVNIQDFYKHKKGTLDKYRYVKVIDSSRNFLGSMVVSLIKMKGRITLQSCMRVVPENKIIGGVSIGNILEYAAFTFGDTLGNIQYSKGKDGNGYGEFGSSIGLCAHKLRQKFYPYALQKKRIITQDIDTSKTTRSTIFFTDLVKRKFVACDFFLDKDDTLALETLELITSRGINAHVIEI